MSLDSLSAQQLTAVKKQLDEEVEHLTTSFAQLQAAQIKFKDCLRCVKTQGATQGELAKQRRHGTFDYESRLTLLIKEKKEEKEVKKVIFTQRTR